MIVVGVVLLVLGLIAAIGVFAGGTAFFTLAVGTITWTTNSAQVFLTGAAVMLVLLAGAQVTWTGWKRQHRQKKDVRSLRRSAEAASLSTTPGQSGVPDQPALEATRSSPGEGATEVASRAGEDRAGDSANEPSQKTAVRPDPGDEIRTRPLDREHREHTER